MLKTPPLFPIFLSLVHNISLIVSFFWQFFTFIRVKLFEYGHVRGCLYSDHPFLVTPTLYPTYLKRIASLYSKHPFLVATQVSSLPNNISLIVSLF